MRVPAFVNWPAKLKPRVVDEPLHMVDVMPTLLALAGAKGSPDHPFDGKDMWKTIAEGAPSPNEDVLIDVEAFRGAVRKGDWKLVKIALLPGKTELFNLARTPAKPQTSPNKTPKSCAISKRGFSHTRSSRSRASGSRPSRPSSARRARRSSIPISTSTTAACRMRSHCFRADDR